MERLSLWVRAYDWIPKVARTIADLGEEEHIGPKHAAEAVRYHSLGRATRRSHE